MKERLKVQVWIHGLDAKNVRKVLVFKTTSQRGSFWQPVTGSVEEGETVEVAALREAGEESGLPFETPPRLVGFEFAFEHKGGQKFRETVFEAAVAPGVVSGTPVKIDPHEHVESKWLTPSEAVDLIRHESNVQALRLLRKKWKV